MYVGTHARTDWGSPKAMIEWYVSRISVGNGGKQVTAGVGTDRTRRANGRAAPSTRYDVEFEVELETVNPEIEKYFSDGHRAAYAVSRADASAVTLYRPDGRAAGKIRRDGLESLRGRFDTVSTEVKCELKA